MRVLQIHNRYRQQGGEDHVVAAEATLLRENGHEVYQHLADNPEHPVPTIAALVRAPWNSTSEQRAAAAISTFNPDVVHIHNTWFQLSPAVVAAAHESAPVVVTLHNYRLACSNALLLRREMPCRLCIDGSLLNGVIHSCYRDPISSGFAALTIANGRRRVWKSQVDLYFALSHFAIDLMSEVGLDRARMIIKDNFVSDPGPRLLPPEASRVVLFVGRLSPEKGIKQLLNNLRSIAEAGLTLKVVGAGPLQGEVETALGANYLGALSPDDVAQQMLQSRVLLVPSICYEGQVRIALEAFAAGLPVVGSSLGGVGEVLANQSGDMTFNPNDTWGPIIASICSDALIERSSDEVRQLWERRFGPKQAIVNLVDAYSRAILEHGRHG